MKQLSNSQKELLKAIKGDEDFTRWLYYSTQYNSGSENIARDFVSKLNFNKRHPCGNATRVSDVKAIITTFIETYDE